jgi:hypothetical protein
VHRRHDLENNGPKRGYRQLLLRMPMGPLYLLEYAAAAADGFAWAYYVSLKCCRYIRMGPLAYVAAAANDFAWAHYFIGCAADTQGWAHWHMQLLLPM